MSEINLALNKVSKRFGGNQAVDHVSFAVTQPELIGMIGPNGAGKTTLTNLMSGMLKPSSGTIYLNGRRIDGHPAYDVTRAGLGRTFQITRALGRMTVMENMMVPGLAHNPSARRSELEASAHEILSLLTINHLTNELSRALSGGQRKLLELGRLLMLDPSVIILDEPFAGVHPRLQDTITNYIYRVHENGKAIIFISHNMGAVFELSQRLIVLHNGALIADGEPQVVRNDPAVIDAYLGHDEDD
ncbi:MAG: ATP-binding cassette domain-containing protein [Chloroflexota bacterium]|nr:ATP-binding cassette domain-containing protein [Chloroflexota bacterium]